MRALKNIAINGAMILALLFGMTVSATAAASFEDVKALAEQGDAWGQDILGGYYEDGLGVRQDLIKAFYWYQKAANQGYSGGQFSVGAAYFAGRGVRQDYSKAFEWFKKSANQNNEFAQTIIGAMYEYGEGVRQNKTLAKESYGKSCDNGYQDGCNQYKRLNEQGY